jgi:hypothetical protein
MKASYCIVQLNKHFCLFYFAWHLIKNIGEDQRREDPPLNKKYVIAVPLNARDLDGKLFRRRLITDMMHMNGRSEQDLHSTWPSQGETGLHGRLQVAQLVGQADLPLPGMRFQLAGQATTPTSSACQYSPANAPLLIGNTAPALFGRDAPPGGRMQRQQG